MSGLGGLTNRQIEVDQLLTQICQPLGLLPSERQSAGLLGYLDLLERWNGTYNLTAVRDRAGMWTQHLADCLAVVPALTRHLAASPNTEASKVLDVGSGGGLPGCVLAIMLPELKVSCIDSVGKKAAFIRQVAGALGLGNLRAVHSRVEALISDPFDLIASRAFASLTDFTALTRTHLQPAGVWLAMKGKRPDDEIAALPSDVDVFHVEQLNVPGLQAERCLVWMRRRNPALALT